MSIEAMKQWLRALEDYKKHTAGVMIPHTRVQGDKAIASLRQAIAEAEKQEPVLEVVDGQINRAWDAIPAGFTGLLYINPQPAQPKSECPQAERAAWVELTDDEMYKVWLSVDEENDRMAFGKAVEAKLKEKNT